MNEYFEIFGTLIKHSEIKDFRIIQREYIYRPTYKEAKGLLKIKKYTFAGMQPYAAIIDEKGRKGSVSSFKAGTLKDAAKKDLFEDVRTTIGDKFNIKAIRSKKYVCENQTGRVFTTYLEDVPALVGREDGKFSDVKKNDELYPLLGETIAPAINIVPALWIKANQEYIFYGNGIQIDNIEEAFNRLKIEMESYNAEKEKKKPGLLGKFSKPQAISLPKKKQAMIEEKTSTNDIAKLKQALADNVITQEEYDEKLAKIIEDI